jgi:hypothetical protein
LWERQLAETTTARHDPCFPGVGVPFLPFVLLIAWHALSRASTLALSWATTLYFGSVPGNKGSILSIMALVSTGWVILLVGFGVPMLTGWLLDLAGIVGRNFDLPFLPVWGLLAALVLAPPLVAALAEFGDLDGPFSVTRWLGRLPISYPASASLGLAILQMVVITPFLLVRRWRRSQRLLQVPLVLQEPGSSAGLAGPVIDALATLNGASFDEQPLTGPISWPLRTVGFAARHLLGRIVRGDPVLIRGDGLQVIVYATNVGIVGAAEQAHRARAAIEKRLAYTRAFLTWSPDAQRFERMLRDFYRSSSGDGLRHRLDRLQHQIDGASLTSDEWNLLYRLRLQLERASALGDGPSLRRNPREGDGDGPDQQRQPDEQDQQARAPV